MLHIALNQYMCFVFCFLFFNFWYICVHTKITQKIPNIYWMRNRRKPLTLLLVHVYARIISLAMAKSMKRERRTWFCDASDLFQLSHVMRKLVYAICEQQRCRSACASLVSIFTVWSLCIASVAAHAGFCLTVFLFFVFFLFFFFFWFCFCFWYSTT